MKRFLLAFATLFAGLAAYAQVTTSSMSGQIADESGEPLIGAAVVAVHEPSGTQYYAITNNDGRYTITGMRSGGPYNVEVSFLGMATAKYTDVTLQLGETYVLNAALKYSESLNEVVVIASTSKFTTAKTGAAINITSQQMENIPTISRSLTDMTKLSPYANGMGFAGGDGRSSNFTIDGSNFNNNFGLSDDLPGGGTPVSMDAIEEIQVVIAPYDVRQTNFIGGGINAITKSGTNTFKGTAYTYFYTPKMRGVKAYSGEKLDRLDDDEKQVYGFTAGGPIIKNKLFFFINAEYSKQPSSDSRFLWRASSDGVSNKEKFISRVKESDLELVSKTLKDVYGYDTGGWNGYTTGITNMKILARVDWNITDNHRLAFRYNITKNDKWQPTNNSSAVVGTRASQNRMGEYGMVYQNTIYSLANNVTSFSLDLNSRIGERAHNQLLATYSFIDDTRGSTSKEFPHIDILDGTAETGGKILPYISAGYELFSYHNGVQNQIITLKDDFSLDLGTHHILAGLSFEHQFANNSFLRNGTGYYRYKSVDDFINQRAPETVALTYGYNGNMNPTSQVTFNQYGFYLQDEWDITPNFKLTYGTRFDLLAFDNKDIMTNNAIKALDYNGKHIDTGKWPETNIMVSPRVGFVYDVLGDNSLKIRGGAGLFTGRLPLVFFTNMPGNSNMIQNTSSITTTWKGKVGTPDPILAQFAGPMITNTADLLAKMNSLDPTRFPKEITPDKGAVGTEVDAVDPKFKMPMVAKVSLGIDYQLPVDFPLTVTAEGSFTKTIQGLLLSNYNIKPSGSWDRMMGADGRLIYPADYKYYSTDAFVLTNTREGYGYTANLTVNAQPIPSLSLMAAYTLTESKELTGMPGSQASSTFNNLYTVNGAQFATLQRSQYVDPHRVIATATWTNRTNSGFDTHVSLMYEGSSAGGWSYIFDNDINGDGSAYDLIYIPNTPDELKWASADDMQNFWNFVQQDKYLRSHKGQYAEAYSARSPWIHYVDLRVAQDLCLKFKHSTHKLQLSVDLLNLGNLLNPKWGIPATMAANNGQILHCTNAEDISSTVAPIFSFSGKSNKSWTRVDNIYQTWHLQFGIKYMFN